ncbi:MAG: glyoxalase [Chloroflexi bacterium]|nr:glyoxalase [Chloroflexota bacterium]MDL1944104.1 glyoxalase [Chloroflexi bacterium CFX2]
MTTQTNSPIRQNFSIHPAATVGHISLTVASLDNQLEFYQKALGFKLHWREGNRAGLGAGGSDLLFLTEESGLKKYRGVTGLYHVAYLFPNRRELAIAMARLFALKYPNAPTDHIMTKTTYLDDLEGNGIELYCESPEDGTWTFKDGKFESYRKDGSWSDGREPLDVDALFENIREDDRLDAPVPPELRIGHVHLHVRDVDEAVDFYHGVLGFDVMGVSKAFQMAFVSAGGYHHHIGLNTWQGRGAPPPPPDAVGLRHFTVDFPNPSALADVVARVENAGIPYNQTKDGILLQDPSQNGVLLRAVG